MVISDSNEFQNVSLFRFGYHPFSKPRLYCHIFYIDGLLIDTGQSRVRKQVLDVTQNLDIEQIYVTHHHEDHTGNLDALKNQFGVPIYSSKLCKEMMSDPPPISFAQYMFWGSRPAFQDLVIKEDTIQTNNYSFDIIPVPGHSSDMVALHEANEGWLFSADLYVHHYIAYFMKPESVKTQIASLKKILELDFDVIFCSHNPQLKNGKQLIQKKLQFFETFYGSVSELMIKGFSISEIMKRLKMKKRWGMRILSHGHLSSQNMIQSVIRDLENEKREENK